MTQTDNQDEQVGAFPYSELKRRHDLRQAKPVRIPAPASGPSNADVQKAYSAVMRAASLLRP